MERLTEDDELLIAMSKRAAMFGYSYSGTKVGAALQTENGELYRGTNVSNTSPSLTMCAERMAVFNAVGDGARNIAKLAVYSPNYEVIAPCGHCRQVIYEFARSAETLIIMCGQLNGIEKVQFSTIGELLPFAFSSRRAKNSILR